MRLREKSTPALPPRKNRGVGKTGGLDFPALVQAIRQVHSQSAASANRAVNTALTLRNWAIGCYIREYEQRGADRAKYGTRLLERLSETLKAGLDLCYTARYLGLCRQVFDCYPQIRKAVISESAALSLPRHDSSPGKMGIRKSAISEFGAGPDLLLEKLSFTHLVELLAIDDPLKRSFYEIECMRSHWSVRDLKRQIATLYFERSGLSKDKEKLSAMPRNGARATQPALDIRDPYIFEFLGLRAKDAMGETELEASLVENLREFLLELGHGFCLEAQQKSIVIGKTRGFVDLVFYHRILKCHVLVELKVDSFRHEHIGQLNTYVTWYRKHIMARGDNPPIGILLCTEKDHSLVEYAIDSMDNRLFVSKYAVELPTKTELIEFLKTQNRSLPEHPPGKRTRPAPRHLKLNS
jgi:predicted nuclease of restriction endonuclease-like (RecB) superfamily